jgi:hypothetical protein
LHPVAFQYKTVPVEDIFVLSSLWSIERRQVTFAKLSIDLPKPNWNKTFLGVIRAQSELGKNKTKQLSIFIRQMHGKHFFLKRVGTNLFRRQKCQKITKKVPVILSHNPSTRNPSPILRVKIKNFFFFSNVNSFVNSRDFYFTVVAKTWKSIFEVDKMSNSFYTRRSNRQINFSGLIKYHFFRHFKREWLSRKSVSIWTVGRLDIVDANIDNFKDI